MKRLAATFVAICSVVWALNAFAQIGGLSFPGPGPKVASGGASAPAFGWQNIMSNSFFGAGASITLGVSNPASTCGTINVGDFLQGGVLVEANVGTIAIPAGWTRIGTQQLSSGAFAFTAAYKIATSGDTTSFCNTTGYTFTWTGANFAAWYMKDYIGVNATPIDGSPSTASYSTGAGSTFAMTGVTTASSPDTLIADIYSDQNTITLTCPAGFTTRINNQNQESGTVQIHSCDNLLSSSGATGNQTMTVSGTLRTGSYALFAVTHP